MDPKQITELERALNGLDPSVVRGAIDAMRHHPRRTEYEVLGFSTGAAEDRELGTRIRPLASGNYAFRISVRAPASAFDLSDGAQRFTFSEILMTATSVHAFTNVLREVLRDQGWTI